MRTLLLVTLALAPCTPVPPVRDAAAPVPETRAHEIACDLADRVGPRSAGSDGDRRARAWAVERLKALGLENVRDESFTVPLWQRGTESAALVSPGTVPLAVTALGYSASTPPGGIEAEVVRVTSLEEAEALPEEKVRGKIVFYDRPMKRGPRGFETYGDAVTVRGTGAHVAAKKGAVASVIRSIGTSQARFPHTGMQRSVEGKLPAIPAGALAIPDAEVLTRWFAKGEPVRMRLVLESKSGGELPSGNVIGEIRGTEKPDEIVVLGAHLDSWDLGPGAVDDAAGVGAVLEIARLLKAKPPRRTVRVVLYGSEETGIRGAFAYAKAHEAELAKHHSAIEMDEGAGRALDFYWNAGPTAKPAMDAIARSLAPLGIANAGRSEDAGGADLIPLGFAGVPRLQLSQDATRYFDLHHTADDTCDKIVPADLAHATAAASIVVRALADQGEFLERAPVPPPR